ncbi:MAG: DUF4038 domain-containing protein, partial [Caldilineales bacterium]
MSTNGRYLVKASNGDPFFYLGDEAWTLFYGANRSQADYYLSTRAAQGFTATQAVLMWWSITTPNGHGDVMFINSDPTQPNITPGSDPNDAYQYDYWDHVDYIVDRAYQLGMYTVMLPAWGSWMANGIFSGGKGYTYGYFLGQRYGNKPVIWMLGGDYDPDNQAQIDGWAAMAQGIIDGAGGNPDDVLLTYHPSGYATSATWFHNAAWLDYNTWQTGHCKGSNVWNLISSSYNLTPVKPVMDSEPMYENIPICFNAGNGYATATDIRTIAYWDVFAGAFGHTYGHYDVWAGSGVGDFGDLTAPGALQMQYLKALMISRPQLVRIPDQGIITNALSGDNRIQATRGTDYLFVYSATGQPFSVNMGRISGSTVTGYWYNPRDGGVQNLGTYSNSGTRLFTPPSSGLGNDWVLILDDSSKGYLPPGQTGSTPTATPVATSTPTSTPEATVTPTAMPTNTPGGPTFTATPTPVPSPDVIVYGDALAAGWQSWSWGTTINFANITPVQNGTQSIALTYTTGWAGLSLRSQSLVNPSLYTGISFWVYGVSGSGSMNFHIQQTDSGVASPKIIFTPTAGQWTQFVVPWSQLGNPTQIARLTWQENTGSSKPTFYIDNVRLLVPDTSPTATPTHTATAVAPTATPTHTAT